MVHSGKLIHRWNEVHRFNLQAPIIISIRYNNLRSDNSFYAIEYFHYVYRTMAIGVKGNIGTCDLTNGRLSLPAY